MLQDQRASRPTIVEELVAALAPHPKGLRRWSVMRAIRKSREAVSREIPLKLEADVERTFRQFCRGDGMRAVGHGAVLPPRRKGRRSLGAGCRLCQCRRSPVPGVERLMAPRPPNYSQDRLQRERAQAAKAREKAERRAEETARRKAEQAKPDAES